MHASPDPVVGTLGREAGDQALDTPSRMRNSTSAREPASAAVPCTGGAANGKTSVGASAGRSSVFCPPAVSTTGLEIHSTSASTSANEARLAGSTHRAAPVEAWSR